jgi:hypothetical protein
MYLSQLSYCCPTVVIFFKFKTHLKTSSGRQSDSEPTAKSRLQHVLCNKSPSVPPGGGRPHGLVRSDSGEKRLHSEHYQVLILKHPAFLIVEFFALAHALAIESPPFVCTEEIPCMPAILPKPGTKQGTPGCLHGGIQSQNNVCVHGYLIDMLWVLSAPAISKILFQFLGCDNNPYGRVQQFGV